MIATSEGSHQRCRFPARCDMHILIGFLVVSFLTNAGLGQPRLEEPENNVRIGKLMIESNGLPDADRERIIRMFQHKTYREGEISERIRQALRNVGYFKAVVDEPKLSFPAEGSGTANVAVKVEPGVQYRLGEIRFQRATIFPAAQLRNIFSQRKGDLFNTTKFSVGLDDVRKLYATRGYVNMIASPVVKTDESRRTIDLVLEVDEGQAYDFGKLYLEGVEPHPGAGKALLNSWKPLEGRRYNPVELQHWLLANHFDWKVSALASDSIKTTEDSESRVVNVTLTQWPNLINR